MSPTYNPAQPALCAARDSRSMKAIALGCPQLRFRERRIACQPEPVSRKPLRPFEASRCVAAVRSGLSSRWRAGSTERDDGRLCVNRTRTQCEGEADGKCQRQPEPVVGR